MKTARVLALVGILGVATIAAGAYLGNAVTWVAGSGAVSGEEPQAQARLVSDFSGFAGSEFNARRLVAGLRQGNEITLVASTAGGRPGATTRFTPPTLPMDYSSIRVALGLAREQLAQLGVNRPTPAQIKAALAGGGVASHVDGRSSTPFLLPGILQMRAGGMSWARIAGTMGVTLAQRINGAYPAEPAALLDSAHASAPRVEQSVLPTVAARPGSPVLRRATAEKAAPISSVSIMTSEAGGPTTRAMIRRAEPARRANVNEPAPQPRRRARAQAVAAAGGAASKEAAPMPAPDRPQAEALPLPPTAAAATGGPARIPSDPQVD